MKSSIVADLEARLAQRGRRAAGRDELDAERGQPAREVDDAGLVGDGQQRAPDPDLTRLRHRPPSHRAADDTCGAPVIARPPPGADAPGRAARRRGRSAATASHSRSCSSGRSASRTSAGSVGVRAARPRAAAITGPVSTPSSTKWTVTPKTFTPYSSACSIARTPGERRQQRGMDVDDALREAGEEGRRRAAAM